MMLDTGIERDGANGLTWYDTNSIDPVSAILCAAAPDVHTGRQWVVRPSALRGTAGHGGAGSDTD
jgi:hypothetical protein